MHLFRDRRDAGRQLADSLRTRGVSAPGLVLALPRGGVPVGYEVAAALGLELDILLVRKLGVPGHEELAMGALASGGHRVVNEEVVRALQISRADIDRVAEAEQRELERRERAYRGERPHPHVEGRQVVLVDDGLATGASMRAATIALRGGRPGRITVAVPTGAPDTCRLLEQAADEVVCVIQPTPFMGVGMWYEDFSQTTDREVRALIERARGERARPHDELRPRA